ncbi:MAG: hypothetical protein AAF253_01275 [Pseudomonadota bacterium]
MLDWIISLGLLAALSALAVLANWKAGQPWNDLKPRIIPWRLVLILTGFAIVLVLVHIANLLGVETGPDKSPFGRF